MGADPHILRADAQSRVKSCAPGRFKWVSATAAWPLEDVRRRTVRGKLADLRPVLLRRAVRLLGGQYAGSGAPDAADLAQQVLARLSEPRHASVLELPADELRRYALRALHNIYVDRCVKKRREASYALEMLPEQSRGGENAIVERMAAARRLALLKAALEELDEQPRAFIVACLEHGNASAAQQSAGWPPGSAANAGATRNRLLQRVLRAVQGAS